MSHNLASASEEELREWLWAIDNADDIDCDRWECDFLESVLRRPCGAWTEKQRGAAVKMIEKYRRRL